MSGFVRASFLHGYFDFCREQQLDAAKLLRSADLPENIDPFSEYHIPLNKIVRLTDELKKVTHFEHVALLLAKKQSLNILGVLGQLMASACTLRDAWQDMNHYKGIYTIDFTWVITQSPPYLTLGFSPLFQTQNMTPMSIEVGIAQMYNIFREITGWKWQPQGVHFRHQAPPRLKAYKDFFGAPLHFNAEFDGLWLLPSDLNLALPSANPHLHAALCKYADSQMKMQQEDRIVKLARTNIKQSLPTQEYQLPLVAKGLKMSPRNLQQKLQLHGYSYEALVMEVRLELSFHYLQHGHLPITRIAENVGYKNTSTFSAAFKKHQGLTPREWRLKHGKNI